MKKYLKEHEWSIIEEGFDPENHEVSESIFSIHYMVRANFEETYSGDSLKEVMVVFIILTNSGRLVENGYPEYFLKY